MPRTHAVMSTVISTKLADTALSEFVAADINYQIEESLKELSGLQPHLFTMTFKLESRQGTDVTGTASKLTDSVKSQFVAADATQEKVAHNTTDNTWAVVLTRDSASVLSLSANIMAANEKYEIYNKGCWNKKQINLRDFPGVDAAETLPEFLGIHSVEYPIGTERNWKMVGKGILELDIDSVPDSDSTLDTLNDVTVLVRFMVVHLLPNLTDYAATFSATASADAISVALTALQSAGTVKAGTEIAIENHKSRYVVYAEATIASSAVTLSIIPPLESAIASTAWVATIVKSTLDPSQEDILAELVAGRLMQSRAAKYINAIPLGGGGVGNNYYNVGKDMVDTALTKLSKGTPPKTKRRFPT